MALNLVELGRAVTFAEYPFNILPKNLTWNKIELQASTLLNFPKLVVNEVKKTISKNIYQYSFFYPSYHCFM